MAIKYFRSPTNSIFEKSMKLKKKEQRDMKNKKMSDV